MSDQLVERARRGDVDAFVELIAARQESMVRIAYAILGEPADADDALQEALAAIWRGLPSLRDPARFAAWSDRILVNACRLALRRRSRARAGESSLDVEGNLAELMAGQPGHGVDASDEVVDRLAFDRAFASLDADARAILVLHHLEGRGVADLAAALDVPVGTVKSRLFAARRGLERALDQESDRAT